MVEAQNANGEIAPTEVMKPQTDNFMAEDAPETKPVDSPPKPKTMLQALCENGMKENESIATLATEADQQSSKVLMNGDVQEEAKDLNGVAEPEFEAQTAPSTQISFHPKAADEEVEEAEEVVVEPENVIKAKDLDLEVKRQAMSEATAEVPESDMAKDDDAQSKKKKKRNKKKKNKNKKTMSELDEESESVDISERRNNFMDSDRESRSTVSQATGVRGFEEPEFTPLKEKLDESFFEDQDSSEDEGMPDYKIGGYHPIHVGEILLDRYVIIQKLGWGHFSTVWLTKDLKYSSYVAIKVQKSAQHYLEAAYDEVEILDQVAKNWRCKEWESSINEFYSQDAELQKSLGKIGMSGDTSHCVQLLNSFIHHGPNGKHFVMVFEILGVNFLEIIKRYNYQGVPMPLARRLARQCLIGLDYMHRMCKIIHTDFKPENVVVGLKDHEVAEIAKTGQLTTTKMSKNVDHLKKLNMKVAGTLPVTKKEKKEEAPSTSSFLADSISFEGLTSKQRKNMKKKLNRKRKKAEAASNASKSIISMSEDSQTEISKLPDDEDDGAPDLEEINIDDIAVGKQPKKNAEGQNKKKGKGANTTSQTRDGEQEKQFDGLLGEEATAQEKADKEREDKEKEEELKRGPRIGDDVQVKICDMGNGCWTYHHFTPEIQTRQYRSPEVIIGADYNTSADIWSFACTIFEMVTGDFLFEPRKGQNYDKDDDHLAQMMELLGRMPKNLAMSGKHSRKFFDSKGNLRRIKGLSFWPVKKVLTDKYFIREDEAQAFADFLLPMLEWHHDGRATAQEMLKHPWLNMEENYDFKFTKKEYEKMQFKKEMKGGDNEEPFEEEMKQEMNELIESEPEEYQCDLEGKPKKGFVGNQDLSGQEDIRDNWDDLFEGSSDRSFMGSEEREKREKSAKDKGCKLNNSFSGPYPSDPTDFNHSDKGPNAQFLQYVKQQQQLEQGANAASKKKAD